MPLSTAQLVQLSSGVSQAFSFPSANVRVKPLGVGDVLTTSVTLKAVFWVVCSSLFSLGTKLAFSKNSLKLKLAFKRPWKMTRKGINF